MKEKVYKALSLAMTAHAGQVDKGGAPYINHPVFVALCCDNDDQKIVALLHDVVEDTEITLQDLRDAGFANDTVVSVDAITKREGETYTEYLLRLRKDPVACYVKIRDISHNSMDERLPEWQRCSAWYLKKKAEYRDALELLGVR